MDKEFEPERVSPPRVETIEYGGDLHRMKTAPGTLQKKRKRKILSLPTVKSHFIWEKNMEQKI